MAHEKVLIPHFEEIKLEFKEALEDHQAGQIPSTMADNFDDTDDASAADQKSELKRQSSQGNSDKKKLETMHSAVASIDEISQGFISNK